MRQNWIVAVLAVGAVLIGLDSLRAQDAGHERYVSPWRIPWTYEGARGAEHWSELDPEYAPCKVGKEQSPIDIRDAAKADLPALRFEWKDGPLKYVINNRYTIRVNYHPGNGNILLVQGERYDLTQFHFHRPSEEYVDGKPYDMEVHLMFQASDGKVSGVTVFVNRAARTLRFRRFGNICQRPKGRRKSPEWR